MRIDHDARTITFRQSGLDTFGQCPERARFQWFTELPDRNSDAAVTGTAAHAAFEMNLRQRQLGGGPILTSQMIELAKQEFDYIELEEGINYVKGTKDDAMSFLEMMIPAWRGYIEPYVCVDERLLLEWKFNVPLMMWEQFLADSEGNDVSWEIRLEGTVDCVDRYRIWDWKTAGRDYKQWEKQRWAVQPTVYSYAAEYEGLLSWPVTFNYGVAQKLKTIERADVIPVMRHPEHVHWLMTQIESVLGLWDMLGDYRPWPLVDTHALCSEKWCPYWSSCKGAHVPIGKFLWKPE